ncbi:MULTISPECIES: hypothetical protein [unclassified Burkholderia]|uniref:hypothetical protein n=1 Tax=unclassified Burkholderia TaxID=2613784 RepID=UPI000F568EF7|nr:MULTISPECIES: hypothetical protein [unclassified Burkholderia]
MITTALQEYLTQFAASWQSPTLDPKSFGMLKYSTPLRPDHYLAFAEKDLRLGGPRGLVNSLANSKRAIDCQIFGLLCALGLPEPRNFPDRLEKLKALGLLAPRVVKKIAQLRNVLEHQYYKPTLEEAEDALDIAALFLGTLRPYFAGGSYMENAWLADEASVNPRGQIIRTRTHTTWSHANEPRFTYARGIFVVSETGAKSIELALIHDNVEIANVHMWPSDASYVELQGLLLRSLLEDLPYSKAGARRFLKVLKLATAHAEPNV